MEALLVALIALAVGLLVWRARPAGGGPRLVAGALTLVAASTAGASFVWPNHPLEVPTTRPLVQPDDGYVGSASCRSCHPEEHATWHESFHRTMSQVATRDTVAARFERLDESLPGLNPIAIRFASEATGWEFGNLVPGTYRVQHHGELHELVVPSGGFVELD